MVGPGADSSGRGRRRSFAIGVGAVAVVLVLVAAAFLVLHGRGGGDALRVTLLALDAHQPDAFAESVVTVKAATARDFANKRRGDAPEDRTARGDTKSLYGSSTATIADPSRLTPQLTGERGAAWAGAMGVDTDDIAATLGSITPLVLSHDLFITDHGYSSSGVTERPVVLEAGSTVGVDQFGEPVVNLATGDPLSQATVQDTQHLDYVGDRWDGFNNAGVIEVERTDEPVDNIDTIDIATGAAATTTLGGTISLDGYLVSDDTGVAVVSLDGKTTTQVLGHPVAKVLDDGQGGILYQERRPEIDGRYPHGNELVGWRPKTNDQAAIWHLAAGATKPTKLIDPGDPNESWVNLNAAGTLGGNEVVVYGRFVPDGPYDTDNEMVEDYQMHVRDLATGDDQVIGDRMSDYETWPRSVTIGHNELAYTITGEGMNHWHRFDANLDPLDVGCTATTEHACWQSGILDDNDQFLASQASTDGTFAGLAIVDLASGESQEDLGTVGIDPGSRERFDLIGRRDSTALVRASTWDTTAVTTYAVDLDAHTAKRLSFNGQASYLQAPLIRPRPPHAGGSQSHPATTTAPPSTEASTTTATSPATTATPTTAVPAVEKGCSALQPSLDAQGWPAGGEVFCGQPLGVTVGFAASNYVVSIYDLRRTPPAQINEPFMGPEYLYDALVAAGDSPDSARAMCEAIDSAFPTSGIC